MMTTQPKYNLQPRQQNVVSRAWKHDSVIYPAATPFNFGATSSIFIRANGQFKLHELILEINTSAISGVSGTATGYPNFNPMWWILQKFDILVSGTSIENVRYDLEQWVLNNIHTTDESRILVNATAGSYSSITSRYNLSNATTTWLIPLKCFVNETHFNVLSAKDELEVRISLPPITNVVSLGAGQTGTPTATINFAQIRAKISRIPVAEVVNLTKQLTSGIDYRYHKLAYQPTPIAAGSTNYNITLTNISGVITYLFFTIRPVASLTGNAAFTSFLPVSQFFLTDAGGQSIVGGQPVLGVEALTVFGKDWTKSSFLADSFLGINNTNLYFYSFSLSPIESHTTGQSLNGYKFTGLEQLNFTMASSVAATSQLEVWAYTQNILHQTANGTTPILVQ